MTNIKYLLKNPHPVWYVIFEPYIVNSCMCKYKTSIETKAYFMCWTEVETISLIIQNKFYVRLKLVGYETLFKLLQSRDVPN